MPDTAPKTDRAQTYKSCISPDFDWHRFHKFLRHWFKESGELSESLSNDFELALERGIAKWNWIEKILPAKNSKAIMDVLDVFPPDHFEAIDYLLKSVWHSHLEFYLPSHTALEWSVLLPKFINYLQDQKDTMIETGHPEYIFKNSDWLFRLLSRTCVVKNPLGVHPVPLSPGEVPYFNFQNLYNTPIPVLVKKLDDINHGMDPTSPNGCGSGDGYHKIYYFWGEGEICYSVGQNTVEFCDAGEVCIKKSDNDPPERIDPGHPLWN
ncbi:MAG TPA: hypothetical protein PK360_07055, partial [bacterium]|nr:hypothetical protein [bacterium]